MRILLIGYGSIGRRHDEVLSSFPEVDEIHLVTKQRIENRLTFFALEDVVDIEQYDYFLITTETNKHYEQLVWLNERVKEKKIFCEKPLFDQYRSLPMVNNEVYVGYVLRFHPILQKIKKLLCAEAILSANIVCGSYLPTWRKNIDYRDSYSAKKDEGGGVLLDLSHELDYSGWIFGQFVSIKSYQTKVSNLEIDSDDLVSLIAKTSKNTVVNLVIDYFSKSAHRLVRVNTNNFTIEADLIRNVLVKTNVNGEQDFYSFDSLERNDMFISMHREILFLGSKEYVCSLEQAMCVMRVIREIQDENNE